MPEEMRELAIYHELKEIAGKERGLSYNEAHSNARKGEIAYAKDMGLTLKENPSKYELDYARHMMSAEEYKKTYSRKRLRRIIDERDRLLRSARYAAKKGKPFKVHFLNKAWEEMEESEKKLQNEVEKMENKK
jgi:phage regulator Rha-like protein